MVENNVLAEKSLAFSIRIVNCYKFLTSSKQEFVMSKQLLRSGTSIGANAHEAIYAQSKADFVNKISISLKEAGETVYWLKLLFQTEYLNDELFTSLRKDVDAIIRILVSTLKTTRNNEQVDD